MEVRGKGMEVELLAEPPVKPGGPATQAAAPARKAKSDGVSGVKRVTLQSNVEMYLYVDSTRSGLPGSDREPAKPSKDAAAKNAADEEKAQVIIKTPGRFEYLFLKDYDFATFDLPAVDPKNPARSPEDVTVNRHMPKLNTDDHLVCKHLELRLTRKDEAPPAAGKPSQPKPAASNSATDRNLQIETARATGGFKEVVIISDTEKLEARCSEFIYDARKLLTILRAAPGEEMEANRDGSFIHAREMQIQEIKPAANAVKDANGKVRTYQEVLAKGPGRVDMWDKEKEKSEDHASWRDTLTSTRDGTHDLLILKGMARFWNDEQQSFLQGDTLKVWVMPREPEADPKAKSQPAVSASPRVDKVEAIGNVYSKSRDLIIHDTHRLVLKFKDAPTVLPPARVTAKTTDPAPLPPTSEPATTPPEPMVKGAVPPPAAPAQPEEPPRPISLTARTVDATVLRGGGGDTAKKPSDTKKPSDSKSLSNS